MLHASARHGQTHSGQRAGTKYHKPHFVAGGGEHSFAGFFSDGQTPADAISYTFDTVFCTLDDELAINLFGSFDRCASFGPIGVGCADFILFEIYF